MMEPTTPTLILDSRAAVADSIGEDSYDQLGPWLGKLAALAPDDPHRHRLREEILQRGMPLAEHIARRFAGRGEPLDDLVQVACVGKQIAERLGVSPTQAARVLTHILARLREHALAEPLPAS
ncbi:hypothetical protein [Nocardia bhagyanarayanae]|uniref:Sigma-70-like protein n=1 Tax=Nocardia bhagyanarayanae TaxID=1215925 RepID=A0A543FF72_9NOCA|nr:sigma-70-like protein [Nocardia bhagyanarayanae]